MRPALIVGNEIKNSDFLLHEHSIECKDESIYDDKCTPIETTDNLSSSVKLETKSEINCDELDDHLATNNGIVVVAAGAITDNDVNESNVLAETVGRNSVIEKMLNEKFVLGDGLNEMKNENVECAEPNTTNALGSIISNDDDDHNHRSINLLNDQAKVIANSTTIAAYDRTGCVPINDDNGTTNLLQSITSTAAAAESALSLLIKNQNTADDNDRINISQQQHEHFSDECTFESIQLNDHNNDIVCANGLYPTTSGVEATATTEKTEEQHSGYTCESNYSMNNTNTHTSEVTVHSVENERSIGVDDAVETAAAKFTSLTMITQDSNHRLLEHPVSVVATDMIRIVSDSDNSVTVKHTNSHYDADNFPNFTKSFDSGGNGDDDSTLSSSSSSSSSKLTKNNVIRQTSVNKALSNDKTIVNNNEQQCDGRMKMTMSESVLVDDDVTVVASADTLSAVVCLEDGLADDDSWVEEISHDEEEFATTTATESDVEEAEDFALCTVVDREEELRGFNRSAIDFTLHTIVEESCEESEVELNSKTKNRVSASELEKYFFYGLGEGKPINSGETKDESLSDSSSICSDGIDSNGGGSDDMTGMDTMNSSDLASSRLEKYFLTTFMGFAAEQRDTDGSGSVGSDSEGCPSPGQRRKRLVRARGTPRSHNSSLDNLLATNSDCHETNTSGDNHNDFMDYSESDTCDETVIHVEKSDNSNDTLKRKKQNKKRPDLSDENKLSSAPDLSVSSKDSENDHNKTLQNEFTPASYSLAQSRNQHSRDSGFIGSNDDLLKPDDIPNKSTDPKFELEEILEEQKESVESESSPPVQANPEQQKIVSSATSSAPATTASTTTTTTTALYRKDSFNNWSSDEETNLMMSKMRQFFKTLIAASANAQHMANNSKSTSSATVRSGYSTPKDGTPVPRPRNKHKPPQLVYFENELTRLMKTVPGINDSQVREIVEYLSSEDTWSDSYDSSDYTSSDLEGNSVGNKKSELQEQISASCQQIIEKFDNIGDEEGDRGDGGLLEDGQVLNWETAHVYQKLVASFSKMTTTNEKQTESSSSTSPPIFTKVMSHIGTRLVALMHEVSSGESHASTSPKSNVRYHRKLQQKISATTTEDDDSTSESNMERHDDLGFTNLPRSKSHDLLLSGTRPQHHQSSSGVDTTAEEKEASDYERFSWRGSFESALLANGDSRTKLTLLDKDNSSSASALAAKRRSAGDLLFNQNSLSREQLDRVRSCGSIGYENDIETSKLWTSSSNQKSSRRRSSVPDATCDSDANTSDEDDRFALRSTLPRSLQNATSASTNSLPRLSTTNSQLSASMQKSQSVNHFLPNSVKSARYRPPGFNRPSAIPKKAVSSPGLQQSLYLKRDTRRRANSFYGGEFFLLFFFLCFCFQTIKLFWSPYDIIFYTLFVVQKVKTNDL